MVHNKWREIWRLSVERKKVLQETLEHLIELDRFSNFEFDEWRSRYLNWIKSERLRIMDFFRRHDKQGYGTLTREQFVKGFMNSGFPTNKMELSSVFDRFAKNGQLDYMNFIEILKNYKSDPSGFASSPREISNWRQVDDEVVNQISRCQCCKQFPAFKLADGKYTFGSKSKQYLLRFVNRTVMVRVGGGWVSLDEFLATNDPCRAKNRTNVKLRNLSLTSLSRSGSITSLNTAKLSNSPAQKTGGPKNLVSKMDSTMTQSMTNLTTGNLSAYSRKGQQQLSTPSLKGTTSGGKKGPTEFTPPRRVSKSPVSSSKRLPLTPK
ncbi:hypothetical protein HELRODRAFT_117141 [Helobdella robusta]|uniref:GAR domain-containing protein n=1 Tax=Helobdella robusta TaxID=6412 RepID=T1EGK5_HELRO|nr:hypothetical protein HELRODRAFT_117141 [Helobdella robusta]ESO09738.1 hypothetical protein HELRODRAFT_117141 [Helobdella robusta]